MDVDLTHLIGVIMLKSSIEFVFCVLSRLLGLLFQTLSTIQRGDNQWVSCLLIPPVLSQHENKVKVILKTKQKHHFSRVSFPPQKVI